MSSYQGVTIKIFEKDVSRIPADCQLYRSGSLTLKGANESLFLDYPYAGPPRLTQSVKKNVGKMAGGKTYDRAVFSVKAHEIKRFKRIVIMILDKVDDSMKPTYTHEYNLRFVIARALNEANIRKMKTIHIPTISLGCDQLLSFCIVMQAICIYFESCGSTGIKEIFILCSDKEEYNSIVEFMEGKTILQPGDVAGFHRLRTFVEKKTLKCEEDSIPRRRINMGVAYATFINNGYFEKRFFKRNSSKSEGVSISSDVDMESEKEEGKDSISSDSEGYDPNAEQKKKKAVRRRTRTLKKRSETREGSVTSIASIESVRSKNAERQRRYREKRKREKDEAEVERRRLSDLERQRNLRTRQSEDTPAEVERRRLLESERIRQLRTRQSEDNPADDERRRLLESERIQQLRHFVLGQLKFVRPRYLESFAIRLLAQNQRGVKSFEELRTVDGTIYPTFVEAAKALRIMNSEVEWDQCLNEAAALQNPTPLRRLFISILLYCAPANPFQLWSNHKEEFYANTQWSEGTKEAHALFHIRSGLRAHGMELEDFNLPGVDENLLPPPSELDDDSKERALSQTEAKKMGKDMFKELTEEQKAIVKTVTRSVANDEQCYFIEGIGRCGKTKVYQCIYYLLEGEGLKTCCVAHTGVAASLLPNGQTAHRAFGIPLTVEEGMTCKVSFGTDHEATLNNLQCVLWDEATMTDRRIYNAVDNYFRTLKGIDRPFGGLNFVFGGDWRQTLPIVTDVHGVGVVSYTLQKSDIWPHLKVLHLTKNIRAASDPEYAEWIKQIGEGKNFLDDHKEEVRLIDCALLDTERALIDKIYGDGRVEDRNITSNSSILTVDNQTSLEINEKVLKKLKGEEKMMISRDEHDPQRGFSAILPELYQMITPSGMPPHRLPLKIGAVVILLRNLNVFRGLCNGLRMWITGIGEDMITCTPINGSENTPKTILLHRMAMSPTHAMSRELAFIRWQFPIRLAYAMTINKAQGQTLERVGLLLRSPVFSHGQLYVAVSRVRSRKCLFVCNSTTDDNSRTRNVVYDSVL